MQRWLTSLAVFVGLALPALGQPSEAPPAPVIERRETPIVCPLKIGEIPTDVSVEARLNLARSSSACLLQRAERTSAESGTKHGKRFWPLASQSYPDLNRALAIMDGVACESEPGAIEAEAWAALICTKFPWARGDNPHPYLGHPKGCFQQIAESYQEAKVGVGGDAYAIDEKCLIHVHEWEDQYLDGRAKISFVSTPDLEIIDFESIDLETRQALMGRCRDAIETRDVCSRGVETP